MSESFEHSTGSRGSGMVGGRGSGSGTAGEASARGTAGGGDRTFPSLVPPKRYRIGEVVQYSGFSRQTVHNYTVMGLIRESDWTDGGHRLYEEDVFERLALIKSLKGRHSLREIKGILDSDRNGV